MANKAAITTLINAFTDGGVNTASEFRTFMTTFLDSVYPTVLTDSQATETYTDKETGINYEVRITKQGRVVRISGIATNASGSPLSSPKLFGFKAGELYPETATAHFVGYNIDAGYPVGIQVSAALGVKVLGAMPELEQISFVITYNTLA